MKTVMLSVLVAFTATTGFASVSEKCSEARIIGSDDAKKIYVTEPCEEAPKPRARNRYPRSDYFTKFKTWEEAAENCFHPDYIQGAYNWRFRFIGYTCAPNNNQNGGE